MEGYDRQSLNEASVLLQRKTKKPFPINNSLTLVITGRVVKLCGIALEHPMTSYDVQIPKQFLLFLEEFLIMGDEVFWGIPSRNIH